jgi:winged helix DNA-binding protein
VRRARVGAQLLHRPSSRGVLELVERLVGVQAQLPSTVPLALRARTRNPAHADVRPALETDRSVVRTWAMRGTLHLVLAEDVRWLTRILAPGQMTGARRRLAQLGVDEPDEAIRHLEGALSDGPLTRAEAAEQLRARGVPLDGQAAYHLLRFAALTGHVCFGPQRHGENAFVLLDDWRPDPGEDRRDETELARRYLLAHAPAGPEDFAAWSGLGTRVARRAFQDLAPELARAPGGTFRPRARRPASPADVVRLIPAFDPYLLGWRDRSFAVPARHASDVNRGGGWVRGVALVDGRAVATWTIDRGGAGARVRLRPFGRLHRSSALDAEIRDVERFLAASGAGDGS